MRLSTKTDFSQPTTDRFTISVMENSVAGTACRQLVAAGSSQQQRGRVDEGYSRAGALLGLRRLRRCLAEQFVNLGA